MASGGLDYFQARLTQAPEDAKFAIDTSTSMRRRGRAGTRDPGAARQVRHSVGATRRAIFCLRAAWWPPRGAFRMTEAERKDGAADRRKPATARRRMPVGAASKTESGKSESILFPESAIKFQGTGLQVLERCDGPRTSGEIIGELQKQFDSGPEKIRADISIFWSSCRANES